MSFNNLKNSGVLASLLICSPSAWSEEKSDWQLGAQVYGFYYEIDSIYTQVPDVDPEANSALTGGEGGVESPDDESESPEPQVQNIRPPIREFEHGEPGHPVPPGAPLPPGQPKPTPQATSSKTVYKGGYAAFSAKRTLAKGRGWRSYLSADLNLTDFLDQNSYDKQAASLSFFYKSWDRGRGWKAGVGGEHVWRGGSDYQDSLNLSLYGYRSFTPTTQTSILLSAEKLEYASLSTTPAYNINGWDNELTLKQTVMWKEGLISGQKLYLDMSAILGETATEGTVYDSDRIGWEVAVKQWISGKDYASLELAQEITDYSQSGGSPYSNTLTEADERSITVKYSHSLGKRASLYLSTEFSDTSTNAGTADSDQKSVYLGVLFKW